MNLRPSGYEPDELPGCSTPRYPCKALALHVLRICAGIGYGCADHCEVRLVFGRPGDDLLSQVLRHSTIGAEEFNGRVRDGIGFRLLARATRPAKDGI